ncbi:MAG: hypothetical protein ACO3ZZ_05405 [Solirubrobacterales bacterium]|jgi:hypothetical protein
MASTPEMIGTALDGLLDEVPALRKLKLVFGLDIRAKGDIQTYRVELPGPEVSKGRGEDERCRIEIDRPSFNALADPKSGLSAYRRAVEDGHVRFEGDANVAKLVVKVVETHEQRASLKKVH